MKIELENGIYEIEEKGREGLTSYLHRGKQIVEIEDGAEREINPPREIIFKRVNPQSGIGGMYTIINEALVLSDLRGNKDLTVPKIYDFTLGGKAPASEFNAGIIMERIEGKNLKEKLQERTFGLEATLDIFDKVADSFYHLHQYGIIHLDISLDNIFVRNQEIIPLDYGFARRKEEPIEKLYNGYAATAPSFILNSAAGYEAVNGIILRQHLPEVKKWDGTPGGLRARESNDIYLLGNLLASMLIGEEHTKELNRELGRGKGSCNGQREELILTKLRKGLGRREEITSEEKEALVEIIKICISEKPEDRPNTIEKLMKRPEWRKIKFIEEIDKAEKLGKTENPSGLEQIFKDINEQKEVYKNINQLYKKMEEW